MSTVSPSTSSQLGGEGSDAFDDQAIIAVSVCGAAVVTAIICYILRRRRGRREIVIHKDAPIQMAVIRSIAESQESRNIGSTSTLQNRRRSMSDSRQGWNYMPPHFLTIGEKIDDGFTGDEYLADYKTTKVVVKVPKHRVLTPKDLNPLQLNMPLHRNVLQVVGITSHLNRMCIVTRYCQHGKLDRLHDKFDLTESKRFLSITKDICNGLQHLHQLNNIVDNITCHNLLMDENETVVIADWGYSKQFFPGLNRNAHEGRIWPWRSPESLRTGVCTFKSDIWMVGVSLYEILTKGKDPYDYKNCDPVGTQKLIIKGKLLLRAPVGTRREATRIMRMCLRRDATSRPDAKRLVNELGLTEQELHLKLTMSDVSSPTSSRRGPRRSRKSKASLALTALPSSSPNVVSEQPLNVEEKVHLDSKRYQN